MLFHHKSDVSNSRCRSSVWFLAFSWICGISAGLFLASCMHCDSASLMRALILERVSIVGLLIVLLLPYVLSVAAFYFSARALIYLIAAGKGICFSFCIYLLMAQFSTAGWLLCRLLFFSDFAILVPMFLFWIRCLNCDQQSLTRDSLRYLIVALGAWIMDCCFISPFTVNLLTHS